MSTRCVRAKLCSRPMVRSARIPACSRAAARRTNSRCATRPPTRRSEEHTSELQSQSNIVCRLLLEKKVLKKYFKSTDDAAMGSAYDFYTNEVIPAQPFPRPELFGDAITALAARNDKVKCFDASKIV